MAPDGRPAHGAPTAHVRDAVGADDRAWDAYVDAHPDATFFHQLGWRWLVERCFGHRPHYLTARRNGEIAGVLPLFEMRKVTKAYRGVPAIIPQVDSDVDDV